MLGLEALELEVPVLEVEPELPVEETVTPKDVELELAPELLHCP